MATAHPLPAIAAVFCMTALAGCSATSVVETLSVTPAIAAGLSLTEEQALDSEPVVEMAYAAPSKPAVSSSRAAIDRMIARYSREYRVPEKLVHRVVKRESTYNPRAQNGGHYGLMQIKPETARTMGYRGSPAGLYDAETNLKYGVKYLRGAWMLADGSEDRAVYLYSAGYYYVAKARGMLVETGLRSK
ncbi:lytic transglycosylase domain-containing protein [Oricola sp.]|uniref:lytic transglycosylase domain-containing protein n=1 Tax=Oricola sp. TaxID=1979950 RepID=UPI0025CCC8C0|nr:lytic transglycosylase domain-containing protein [Oricola sp.]MCI5077147.1 lytic transglycosylase domain-containing protein [Oricola sp.]